MIAVGTINLHRAMFGALSGQGWVADGRKKLGLVPTPEHVPPLVDALASPFSSDLEVLILTKRLEINDSILVASLETHNVVFPNHTRHMLLGASCTS